MLDLMRRWPKTLKGELENNFRKPRVDGKLAW
jgi:hypothetical protein